jgi:hypothetical protein
MINTNARRFAKESVTSGWSFVALVGCGSVVVDSLWIPFFSMEILVGSRWLCMSTARTGWFTLFL